MPVVPFTPQVPKAPSREPPEEPWALMAAAQMHSEGRLTEPTEDEPDGQRTDR